jgi:hypothetical protein
MKTDTSVAFPHMIGIMGALETELEERDLPAVGIGAPRTGLQFAIDRPFMDSEECEGEAWVALGNIQLSSTFPEASSLGELVNRSGPLSVMAQVGIMRCAIATSPDATTLPTLEQYIAEADMVTADMLAIRAAICRYFQGLKPPMDVDFRLGEWTPTGQDGLAVGGAWTVYWEAR